MSKLSLKSTAIATAVAGVLFAGNAAAEQSFSFVQQSAQIDEALKNIKDFAVNRDNKQQIEAYLVILKQETAADLMSSGRYTEDKARQTYELIEQAQREFASELSTLDPNAKIFGTTKVLAPAVIISADKGTLNKLKLNRNVEKVLPIIDHELHVEAVNPYINAAPVNASGNTAQNQTVAVLDTGVDYTHKAFGGEGTVEAWDAAQSDPTSVAWPQGIVKGGYDYVRDDQDPIEHITTDDDGKVVGLTSHGTAVSHSVTGIAPGVELLAYSVCAGGCTGTAQIKALEAAMDPNGDGLLDDRADVINMSLGGEFGSTQAQYGSQYLVQRAVKLGTNLVISAGNDSNHPFRIGEPSTTPNALSVGAMTHPSSTTTNAKGSIAGEVAEFELASFGPQDIVTLTHLDFELVYPETNNFACEAFAKDVDFTGKAVLLDRSGCDFTAKALNAQARGAEIVIIANHEENDGPAPVGGFDEAVTVYTFGISKEEGDKLKGALSAGEVAEYEFTTFFESTAGAVAGFSSRGPALDGLLKPEITAPGTSIMVADSGSQDKLAPNTGTSFSGPITAGAVALVREARPELSALEIKAVLMNTANLNITTAPRAIIKDSPLAPISLIGAGLVDVEKAIASPVTAMVEQPEYDTKQAALSFGFDTLAEETSYTKTVEITNHSDKDKIYELRAEARYDNDAQTDALSWDFPETINVPAGRTLEFDVTLTIDPSKLHEWKMTNPFNATSLSERTAALDLSEYDGALVFNDLEASDNHALHLVYHVLPKAFSGAEVGKMSADNGDVLTITNTGFNDLSFNSPLLVASADAKPELRYSITNVATTVYGANPESCASGLLQATSVQLADEVMLGRQVGINVFLDVDNDGTHDYQITNYSASGRSVSIPGGMLSLGAPLIEGGNGLEPDRSKLFVGPAFHTTGGNTLTLTTCSSNLGLAGGNIGDPINVSVDVGNPNFIFGGWADIYWFMDNIQGTVPFGGLRPNIVSFDGEPVDTLKPGETAIVDAALPIALSSRDDQIVASISQSDINEVLETRDNNAPVVAPYQVFYVDENAPLDQVIGTLEFSDKDNDINSFAVSRTNLVKVNDAGEIVVTGEIDFEYERSFTFEVVALDAKGNTSESVDVQIRVNDVKGGDDDNDDSGSLAWLALIAAPFAALRRRKQK